MEYIISLVQYTEHYTHLITGITRMKKKYLSNLEKVCQQKVSLARNNTLYSIVLSELSAYKIFRLYHLDLIIKD